MQASGGLLSLEAAEVLDRMREGADRLRNNTNSFLSGELLGLVPVRISVSGESDENSLRIKSVSRHHPTGIADGMCIISISIYISPSFPTHNNNTHTEKKTFSFRPYLYC